MSTRVPALVVSRFRAFSLECHGRIGVGGTGGVGGIRGPRHGRNSVATVRVMLISSRGWSRLQQVHGVLTRLQSLVFSLGSHTDAAG